MKLSASPVTSFCRSLFRKDLFAKDGFNMFASGLSGSILVNIDVVAGVVGLISAGRAGN
jgi:hypothetical protein